MHINYMIKNCTFTLSGPISGPILGQIQQYSGMLLTMYANYML